MLELNRVLLVFLRAVTSGFGLAMSVMTLLLAQSSVAAQLELVAEQSLLSYSATKYGSIVIEGVLPPEARAWFSGSVDVVDPKNPGVARGELRLKKMPFRSGNLRRDDQVEALFKTPVIVRFELSGPCDGSSTRCEQSVELAMNGKSARQVAHYRVVRQGQTLRVMGDFSFDRQDYGLVFEGGFAGTLDPVISDAITLRFELVFSGDESIISVFPELSDKPGSAKVEESSADSWLDQLLTRLRAWLERVLE